MDRRHEPVSVQLEDTLRAALEAMTTAGLTELPLTDASGRGCGLLRESDIAHAIIQPATERLRTPELTMPARGLGPR